MASRRPLAALGHRLLVRLRIFSDRQLANIEGFNRLEGSGSIQLGSWPPWLHFTPRSLPLKLIDFVQLYQNFLRSDPALDKDSFVSTLSIRRHELTVLQYRGLLDQEE